MTVPLFTLSEVFSEKLLSTNYADVIFSETFVYSKKDLTIKTIHIHKGQTLEDFRNTKRTHFIPACRGM